MGRERLWNRIGLYLPPPSLGPFLLPKLTGTRNLSSCVGRLRCATTHSHNSPQTHISVTKKFECFFFIYLFQNVRMPVMSANWRLLIPSNYTAKETQYQCCFEVWAGWRTPSPQIPVLAKDPLNLKQEERALIQFRQPVYYAYARFQTYAFQHHAPKYEGAITITRQILHTDLETSGGPINYLCKTVDAFIPTCSTLQSF